MTRVWGKREREREREREFVVWVVGSGLWIRFSFRVSGCTENRG